MGEVGVTVIPALVRSLCHFIQDMPHLNMEVRSTTIPREDIARLLDCQILVNVDKQTLLIEIERSQSFAMEISAVKFSAQKNGKTNLLLEGFTTYNSDRSGSHRISNPNRVQISTAMTDYNLPVHVETIVEKTEIFVQESMVRTIRNLVQVYGNIIKEIHHPITTTRVR